MNSLFYLSAEDIAEALTKAKYSHSFVGGLTVVRKSSCNLLKQQKG
jgi:hypothetical protein